MLGGAYQAKVVPVRVLGKCQASTSDVVNGVLWAANMYPGISNPNPAKIINLSLGGKGACSSTEQNVINELTSMGITLVVAAGNSSADVANYHPANCQNVISVAAAGPTGELTGYSNYGNVTISAAGGDDSYYQGSVYSTIYNSLTSYDACSGGSGALACFAYHGYQGTSQATPHVSAAIADLLSLNPGLTLNNIITLLQASADTQNFNGCPPFNNGCVNNGNLNVANAESYIINHLPLLSANPSSLGNFNLDSNSTTVAISNPTSGPLSIEDVYLSGSGSSFFSLSGSTCSIGGTLAAGGICHITVTIPRHLNQAFAANLIVKSNSNNTSYISLSIPLYANFSSSDVPPPDNNVSSSSGGGGGCSAIKNGDDYGLIIILLLFAINYLSRKKKINK